MPFGEPFTPDEVRALSFDLYGSSYRLEVAAWIGRLQGKPISAKLVAAESGLDYNRVQEQIAKFAKAGVLELEHDPDRRRKDYRVRCDAYWEGAARVLHDLEGGSS